jgi:hypothetical protein
MTVATDPRKTGIRAGMALLGASAVAAPHTGNTNETALATVTIPAGAMGTSGGLHIYATWTYTNSVNNKMPRIRLGGIGGTVLSGQTLTTTSLFNDFRRVRNRGVANSQVASNGASGSVPFGAAAISLPALSVDTSVTFDLVFSAQLALGSETMTLESYEVWLAP